MKRVLIADLQAVGAGDVGQRALPQVRAGVGDAEVLRSVDQAGDVAIRRAAARALLGDADETARRIRLALEVADAEVRAAETRVEEQPIRAAGDDHVACATCSGRPSTPTASGEIRCGSDRPGVAPVQARHSACASQKPLILLRGVTCHVTRPLAFSNVRSEYSGRSRSGAYSHCDGSPALRL